MLDRAIHMLFEIPASLYVVMAAGAVVAAWTFGLGRSVLLARINVADRARRKSEELAAQWRVKFEEAEARVGELNEEHTRELRQRTEAIAALEKRIAEERQDALAQHEAAAERMNQLELVCREKDALLERQEREFKDRLARMSSELKNLMSKFGNEKAA